MDFCENVGPANNESNLQSKPTHERWFTYLVDQGPPIVEAKADVFFIPDDSVEKWNANDSQEQRNRENARPK